jgi:hypothetical protein
MIHSSSPYASPYRTMTAGAPAVTIQPSAPVAAPVASAPAIPSPSQPATDQPQQPGLLMRAQSFLSNLWDTVIGPFLSGLVGLFTGGA